MYSLFTEHIYYHTKAKIRPYPSMRTVEVAYKWLIN